MNLRHLCLAKYSLVVWWWLIICNHDHRSPAPLSSDTDTDPAAAAAAHCVTEWPLLLSAPGSAANYANYTLNC